MTEDEIIEHVAVAIHWAWPDAPEARAHMVVPESRLTVFRKIGGGARDELLAQARAAIAEYKRRSPEER